MRSVCPLEYAQCPAGGRTQQTPDNLPAGILSGVGAVLDSCWGLGERSHILRKPRSPPGFKWPPVGSIYHTQARAEGWPALSPQT